MTYRVLIISCVWPEAESSAAGLRTWNLIHSLQRNSAAEIFFASTSVKNRFSEKLDSQNIHTISVLPNDPSFDLELQRIQPDFVIFDRFIMEEQFGWRVKEFCPNAVRIIDTSDLHFLRKAREAGLKSGKTIKELAEGQIDFKTDFTLRELGSLFRSDHNWLISDFEYDLLTKNFNFPSELLSVHRFQYSPPPIHDLPSFEDRKHFSMIGNFRHPPNLDSIPWLLKEIWPKIRQALPDAEVHIYGAYPPREMMNLTRPDQGIWIKGPVVDQHETLRKYRVNLAPLRFGAGIKGKISDGWWNGTPVVSTAIGAEGMTDNLPFGGFVANDPNSFSENAIRLYQEKETWSEKSKAGLGLIREVYSEEKNSQLLIESLLKTKTNLAQIRCKNWIGMILDYHAYRSTTYFSKWIEEKNKPKPELLKSV